MSATRFTTWLSAHHVTDWFSGLVAIVPPATWKFEYAYLALVIICLVGGIAVQFLKIRSSLKGKISQLLWTNFTIGIFLFAFRLGGIPAFGMDIWRFIQEVALIPWIISIVIFYRRNYKKEIVAEKVSEYKNKFLPKQG